jgi:Xaa-Pro aminopeptidase
MADGTAVDATDSEITPETAGERSTASHDQKVSPRLRAALAEGWDPAPPMPHPAPPDVAPYAATRRRRLSQLFPRDLIAVPAGSLKVRANDTEYPFRASSSFTWLTGETAADAVLVLYPKDGGPDATLYVREFAQAGEPDYFISRTSGALWVGNVPSVGETADVLKIDAKPLTALEPDLRPFHEYDAAVLTGIDPHVDALLPRGSDARLSQALDELRLIKDEWEIERLQYACDATARGFADVARELPAVVGRPDLRGERWLEGTFWRRARLEGNEVGYTSIVGSGAHATTLHWWRNNGRVEPGTLLLCDMGVETDELYTADVTRTFPVSGEWTPAQLRVYRAVQEAQQAGIEEVKAGADFRAAHRAAMEVLAGHLHRWGVLPVPPEVSCDPDPERPGAGLHRRYTLHSTSHMLGIDVHDCAAARAEQYAEGTLRAGHVLTVEPGLYFQVNDRTVPADLRGIGVRIEDDVVVTDGAPRVLSSGLPRDPDELLDWMREAQASPPL